MKVRSILYWKFCLLLVVGVVQLIHGAPEKSGLEVRAEKGVFVVSEDGQTVFRYNRDAISRPDGSYPRAHYIHPLYATDGTLMTEDMPDDHPHHRGVFWAWTQLWVDGERIGDPWHLKGLRRHVTDVSVDVEDSFARLVCDVVWHTELLDTDAGGRDLVSERAIVTVHPAEGENRRIDFEVRLQALQDNIKLGGSMNKKGYGGFSVRIPMPEDLSFSGSDVEPVVNRKAPAAANRWVDFSASFTEETRSGLAIFTHPGNLGYPHGWTLRKANSCQNPVYPGEQPVPLSATQPLVLKYSLFLHGSDYDATEINAAYQRYLNEVE
ncbi:PmoA family protein [Pelagicoccus mobilis]|uniref:PmoA family protein n=1 Tax=Pelagicoccus mobilis TaxID=415221 RepID=A0A934RT19_9BACT|nr:PmoA family protein [Pelagicoccus mobilis]MBK1875908.1 PmoA family protein [Pelagicoccus mobilis]